MRIYNQRLVFDEKVEEPEKLLDAVEAFLRERMPSNSDFLRYAIVEVEENRTIIEVAIIEEDHRKEQTNPITENSRRKFVVVNVVPTGVGAEIGGRIGDATPVTNVLAGIADLVITHPNVLNAALLNYGRENVLYVEGYQLDQFLRKQIGLKELLGSKDHNRIGVILDKGAIEKDRESINDAINAIEQARAIAGIEIMDYMITEEPVGGKALKMESGAFSGEVKNPEAFLKPAVKLIQRGAQAIAVATRIPISTDDLESYFKGESPNPYGGTEALISHTVCRKFRIPTAHAPILSKKEQKMITAKGLVDPRISPEVVSQGYLGSVLKGLHRAPRPTLLSAPDAITLNDVRAIIVPYTCCGGIPVLAVQKHKILVIAVRENKTVLNVTPEKLGLKNVMVVGNYLEAFGIISAIKAGISIESVRRPFSKTKKA